MVWKKKMNDEIEFLKQEMRLRDKKIYAIIKDINTRLDVIENDIVELNVRMKT